MLFAILMTVGALASEDIALDCADPCVSEVLYDITPADGEVGVPLDTVPGVRVRDCEPYTLLAQLTSPAGEVQSTLVDAQVGEVRFSDLALTEDGIWSLVVQAGSGSEENFSVTDELSSTFNTGGENTSGGENTPGEEDTPGWGKAQGSSCGCAHPGGDVSSSGAILAVLATCALRRRSP